MGNAIHAAEGRVEGIRGVDIGYLNQLEVETEVCLHPGIGDNRADGTTNTVASLEEDLDGDAGNIAISAGNEDETSGRN